MVRFACLAGLLALLALPGCRRPVLNDERTFDLDERTYKVTVDPIRQEQKVTFAVSANEPISVVVGLQKDDETLSQELFARQFTAKTLAKAVKTKEAALEVTVPASESAVILFNRDANKPTKVRLKMTN